MPWNEALDTPNVAHDNPTDRGPRLADPRLRRRIRASGVLRQRRDHDPFGRLSMFASAVHAYEVSEALTYVKEGESLPHYAHN